MMHDLAYRTLRSLLLHKRLCVRSCAAFLPANLGTVKLPMTTPPQKDGKRRRITAGLRAIDRGFETLEAKASQAELNFIIEQLKGPKSDQVKHVANFLRNVKKEHALGAKIRTRESMTFANLPVKFVKKCLTTFCDGDEAQFESLQIMSTQDLQDTLYFSLNINGRAPIPDKYPALDYEGPLEALFKQRYIDMGERLKGKDLTSRAWGYFYITAKRELGLPPPPPQ